MGCHIRLEDARKGYTYDQDKIITPKETVTRFRERLKGVKLDILKETVRIDNGRLGIPVYFSVCGRDAARITGNRKQMGKGGTPVQAEASAVMELAERFSFFSFAQNPENFRLATYDEVAKDALSLETIARSVHDESPDVTKALEFFRQMPLKWTRACQLREDREFLVPFDWFFSINEFNGPSAGNCVSEAVSQGICELVERHVSSVVSREKVRVPGIDLKSVTDPLTVHLISKYEKAGIKLFASDFTLNTGIPTVGVLAWDPATFPEKSEIVWTAGTTPNPQKSLSRALTEVAQLGGDFNTGSRYVASGLPKLKTIDEADFITKPDHMVSIDQLPDLSNTNIRLEVESCIEALWSKGMEVFTIETTHADLGIPTFYSIIPGAHFRERAVGTSVGLFCAKLIAQSENTVWAVEQLEKMDRLLPDKYYVKFFKALCCISQNEPERALELLKTALTLEPKKEDVASICSYMGVCLRDLEQYREGIKVLEKGLSADSERTDLHNLLGFCWFKLQEYEKAIAAFHRVLELDPGSAIDYANIASNYRDMGNREMAISFYKMALELDSSIDFARENLERLESAQS